LTESPGSGPWDEAGLAPAALERGELEGSGRSRRPLGSASVFLILLTAALWGGTPVAIRYTVDTLPPIAVAGMRFALAAAFMLVWCRFDGSGLRLRSGQGKPVLVAGCLLFAQISLFNLGIWWSSSSHATMLINTFVFWVVAIEHFVTGTDRLSLRRIVGLLVAAAGAVILFATSETAAVSGLDLDLDALDAPSLAGDAILLASALLLGIKIVYTKHALKSVEPGKLIFWHDVIGVVLFAAYSLAMEETRASDFGAAAILGLLYQGVFVAGLCFALQAHLLKRHSASQIAVFSFSTPLFGIAISHVFRGDPITARVLVAAACVAAGILIVNLRSRAISGASTSRPARPPGP
jgi:drug/metabolite transporter (DMT)-like permease